MFSPLTYAGATGAGRRLAQPAGDDALPLAAAGAAELTRLGRWSAVDGPGDGGGAARRGDASGTSRTRSHRRAGRRSRRARDRAAADARRRPLGAGRSQSAPLTGLLRRRCARTPRRPFQTCRATLRRAVDLVVAFATLGGF